MHHDTDKNILPSILVFVPDSEKKSMLTLSTTLPTGTAVFSTRTIVAVSSVHSQTGTIVEGSLPSVHVFFTLNQSSHPSICSTTTVRASAS